jgi:HSP20 family protein
MSSCCVPSRRAGVATFTDRDLAASLSMLGFPGLGVSAEARATPTNQATAASLPIDVLERGAAYVITASVPGFKKGDLSIEFEEGVLTLAARRSTSAEPAPEGTSAEPATVWHRRERSTLDLVRRIRLPEEVDSAAIAATLEDGVLTVTVPQRPKPQPTKVAIA